MFVKAIGRLLLIIASLAGGGASAALAQDLQAPELDTPKNQAKNQVPTTVLKWKEVPGAKGYRVLVSMSADTLGKLEAGGACSDCLVDQKVDTNPTFQIPPKLLKKNTPYFWTVRAFNDAGEGPGAALRSYTLASVFLLIWIESPYIESDGLLMYRIRTGRAPPSCKTRDPERLQGASRIMALEIIRVEYYTIAVASQIVEAYEMLSTIAGAGVDFHAFKAMPVKPDGTQFTLFAKDSVKLVDGAKKSGLKLQGPGAALLIKGGEKAGALADIYKKLSRAGIQVAEACGIADINAGYGVVLYLKQEDCAKALAALKL